MRRKLKKQKNSEVNHNNDRIDRLERTALLAQQVCILNCLSLIVCCLHSFLWIFLSTLSLIGNCEMYLFVRFQIFDFVAGMQAVTLIFSSNMGFFVHCYYSMMYREAMFTLLASIKKKFGKLSAFSFKKHHVHSIG